MRSGLLWLAAVIVTVGLAVWQRMTGPTYPVRGAVWVGGAEVKVKLIRSGETGRELPVAVTVPTGVAGEVAWRRFPTDDPWHIQPLEWHDGVLRSAIPPQPPAGKVEYQVRLTDPDRGTVVFPERPAVARFKGAVPAAILVPHILAMFLAMAVAARAGFAALADEPGLARLAWLAFALTVVGGFLLGPAVQKYAFGAWWTGVPFGWDLTDNKTLLAGVAWAWALWRLRGGRAARGSVLVAAAVMLVVFSIPHSVWGSQIDWRAADSAAPAGSAADR